ncbi:hypothetical protein KHA80_01245 [Anaerobacillus sp. HL2]|nr:hypothetical protein KHA80_01245 [Anaerobacillus sp. HL2]
MPGSSRRQPTMQRCRNKNNHSKKKRKVGKQWDLIPTMNITRDIFL